MRASQTYQCIVKFDGAGFWTNTIKKQRATCTWSDKVAASRLAERLFGEDNAYITRMPAQAAHDRGRLSAQRARQHGSRSHVVHARPRCAQGYLHRTRW
ncbi:hypothetical protein [Pseudomonas aeruginosa]|uniref:hypothetical protein n=1 Tax=Pseudomonas aeruginosa TaxID=287 RepID=UPI0035A96B47